MKPLAIGLALTAACAAAPYTIQPEPGSVVEMEVHKTGFMRGKVHVFHFIRYEGRLDYDKAKPEASQIELTIQAASIVCQDDWIDAKDKKKVTDVALDMMQHANHPQLRFVSKSIAKRADGGYDVAGDLTIKDTTKPITVMVTMEDRGDHLVFTGTATILRKNYNINPPSPVPFGLVGNKDEMPFRFALLAKPAS
jgi:polyisoprenoid-binding protein YceI